MTDIQKWMLIVCFGAYVGMIIGDIIVIIKCSIEKHKEKKRKRKTPTLSDRK